MRETLLVIDIKSLSEIRGLASLLYDVEGVVSIRVELQTAKFESVIGTHTVVHKLKGDAVVNIRLWLKIFNQSRDEYQTLIHGDIRSVSISRLTSGK